MFFLMFFLFFFFKQKTAYELRISDWSSTCALPISQAELLAESLDLGLRGVRPSEIARRGFARQADQKESDDQHAQQDRKSVVTGKSVSVSVDLGGRRSIKKKKQKTKQ